MRFYLGEQTIEGHELKDWSSEQLNHATEGWLYDIAETIHSYYDDSEKISLTTSGSTGRPKVIHLRKESMRKSAIKTGHKFNLRPGSLSLNCLPAQFIAGKMMIIRAIELGMDQVLIEPKIRLDTSFNGQIDFAAMIPMQVQSLLDNQPDFLNQIDQLIIGGAPLSYTLRQKVAKLKTSSYVTFGMTETITHVAVAPVTDDNASLVFEALKGVYFEVDDGQLIIHADHLATPIKTTDRISLIDQDHFSWLGRSDHVINSGGVKVQPEVLEEQLAPFVNRPFFVSSIPDDKSGEKVILLIEGSAYSVDELNQLNNQLQRLKSGKKPRGIFFIPHFHRTPTGKIKRNLNLYKLQST